MGKGSNLLETYGTSDQGRADVNHNDNLFC